MEKLNHNAEYSQESGIRFEGGVSEQQVEQAKDVLSSQLHATWREGIQAGFAADGKNPDTPRMRASKNAELDAQWFADQEAQGVVFDTDEQGSKLVNTNTPYAELSPSWKQANIGAAEFVSELVASDINGMTEHGGTAQIDEGYAEDASAKVHDKWMEDNSWMRDSSPELFVPYSDLSEDEKQKDRDQVYAAITTFVYPDRVKDMNAAHEMAMSEKSKTSGNVSLEEAPVVGGSSEDGHEFADGFKNPPTPLLENGLPDLNEIRRQSQAGERRSVMSLSEAMHTEGGYHNTHMQNPALHPQKSGEVNPSLSAIKAAWHKSQEDRQ